jgi:hypothetical protein
MMMPVSVLPPPVVLAALAALVEVGAADAAVPKLAVKPKTGVVDGADQALFAVLA